MGGKIITIFDCKQLLKSCTQNIELLSAKPGTIMFFFIMWKLLISSHLDCLARDIKLLIEMGHFDGNELKPRLVER